MMLPPVRCTCKKVIGEYLEVIERLVSGVEMHWDPEVARRRALIALRNRIDKEYEARNMSQSQITSRFKPEILRLMKVRGITLMEALKIVQPEIDQFKKENTITRDEIIAEMEPEILDIMRVRLPMSYDDSLDLIGIDRYCCRIALKKPIILPWPADENQAMIYGFESLSMKPTISSSIDIAAEMGRVNLNNNNDGSAKSTVEFDYKKLLPGLTDMYDERGNRLMYVGEGYTVPILRIRGYIAE